MPELKKTVSMNSACDVIMNSLQLDLDYKSEDELNYCMSIIISLLLLLTSLLLFAHYPGSG